MKINLKKKHTKKIMNRKYPFIIMFFIGFFILIYPFVSQMYYKFDSKKNIENFDEELKKISREDIDRRIKLAKAYNSTLDYSKLTDPYTETEKKQGVAEYARMLEVQEIMGHVEIPKINEDIPIYAGTSNDILQKGAGHLERSSLPVGGENTHSVITAHRGLPKASLFTKLDKMELGDIFFIHNIDTKLAYKVDNIIVVEPTDFDAVKVETGKDYVTLLTCTPYMVNSHRLLVRGRRIEYEKIEESVEKRDKTSFYRKYFKILLILLFFTVIIFIYNVKKYLDVKNQRERYEKQK